MAEDFPDPQNTQDWPESQDDDQRRRCVGDERREEDAADHQLGKGMHHAACSIAGSAARRAASMTIAAPTSASRAARMPPSSVASLPASARAASQIPCGSRAESAVLAVATICDPGSAASRDKPTWLSRIAPAWSKHDRASVRTARCCWLLASARRELDHVLSRRDRRWAPEEAMFRDAMRIAQLVGATRGSPQQRAVLTEALSCFDQAGAIRLSHVGLARLAADPGSQIVATAKTALSARDPQGICDAARALT